ncbi:MAG: PIN domain-containing protein [Chromatiales bacterium]
MNVCVRKLGYSRETAIAAARMVMQLSDVSPLDREDVEQAFQLGDRFGYSHWDALILAPAVRQGCNVLYSEDMQHGQEIDGVVRIENPFAQ